jgi:hypothetical protein
MRHEIMALAYSVVASGVIIVASFIVGLYPCLPRDRERDRSIVEEWPPPADAHFVDEERHRMANANRDHETPPNSGLESN